MSLYTYAKLSQEELDKVQAYKRKYGKRVLVLQRYDPEYPELSDEEMRELQELERALGRVAVVVK